MDTITAVIPVRAGSRRIPNKNLTPFAGTTLLEHKIEVLKKVPEITRILASSDSEKMLQIAAQHGASTHVRPAEYCDEKSLPFSETVRLVCSETDGDHILWAPCTSPLIEAETFSDAIRIYLEKQKEGYDSLLAVEELKKFIWDKDHPLNYELGEETGALAAVARVVYRCLRPDDYSKGQGDSMEVCIWREGIHVSGGSYYGNRY